jgi:branched-subunit amino acid ABC-type transport system permease component
MAARHFLERQFWARAAFTITFFVTAAALFVHYRILYRPLLFPGNPWLSIGLPAFVIGLVTSLVVSRAVRSRQLL